MKPRALVAATTGIALCAAAGWAWWVRHAAQPWQVNEWRVPSLSAEAAIQRDPATGAVTLRASTRLDAVRALGFAHASDRFWQMDLRRRQALGTRAEVLGKAFVDDDELARRLGFSKVADAVWAALPDNDRARLTAYAEGVNAGLASLGGTTAQHRAWGVQPRAWEPRDAILVAQAQFLEWHGRSWERDRQLGLIRERLGLAWAQFFANPFGAAEIPGPKALALNTRVDDDEALPTPLAEEAAALLTREHRPAPHEGLLTDIAEAGGPAIDARWRQALAAPSDWYYAELHFTEASVPKVVRGLSWPGVPLTFLGSNGRVAWGVSPLVADTADLVLLPRSDIDPEVLYVQGKAIVKLETRHEVIAVRGEKARSVDVLVSQWGPVLGRGEKQQYLALHWTASRAEAINFTFADLELAESTAAVQEIAARSAWAPLRLAATDSAAQAVQTAIGRVPVRTGFDGSMPIHFAYEDRRWEGLEPAKPFSVPGAGGTMCTAAGEPWSPWTETLARVLQQEAPRGVEGWDTLRALVAEPATAALVGDAFGRHARARTLAPLLRRPAQRYEDFEYGPLAADEAALRLVREKPAHLLDPRYGSWDDVLVNAAADTAAEASALQKLAAKPAAIAPLAAGWRAWELWGLSLPASSRTHVFNYPSPAPGGEALRAVAPVHGGFRFAAPGGATDHPAAAARAGWHDAWRSDGWVTPAAGGKDAVLLKP
ncbi:penicillin acylase family protein [Nibricoccus sp. IMCC34717]|uniref:penicillin acylase family protein n=1 Tax=Nibricoccus sp. IMCC34717 TaxID=3034021 RepID=UPI00384D9A99